MKGIVAAIARTELEIAIPEPVLCQSAEHAARIGPTFSFPHNRVEHSNRRKMHDSSTSGHENGERGRSRSLGELRDRAPSCSPAAVLAMRTLSGAGLVGALLVLVLERRLRGDLDVLQATLQDE